MMMDDESLIQVELELVNDVSSSSTVTSDFCLIQVYDSALSAWSLSQNWRFVSCISCELNSVQKFSKSQGNRNDSLALRHCPVERLGWIFVSFSRKVVASAADLVSEGQGQTGKVI